MGEVRRWKRISGFSEEYREVEFMNLERYSAIQLGKLVNSKQISTKEVLDYFRNRISERNSSINAIVYQNWEDAYKEAEILQVRINSGDYVGPFAGVPIALKDFLPSKKGWPNTHGGVKSLTRIDEYDSEFYKACKSLGAIAVGKTNSPPFGFSGACLNKLYGQTKNPFNLEYNSGGSSGGSAAAVADGLILIGEGGDAGGSIRIPASWCNLYGFKPSLGTVPSVCRPDAWSSTHPYCAGMGITKTVEDAAILLTAMSSYNSMDPTSLPLNSNKQFNQYLDKSVKGMKVAFTYDFDLYTVDSEVQKIVYDAVKKLEDLGVYVEFVKFNFNHTLEEIMFCWSWSISIDTYLDIYNWKQSGFDLLGEHSDELYEEFIYFQEIASKMDIHNYREFNEIRTDILDNFENVLSLHDFIISPTTICPPMKISDNGKVTRVEGVNMDSKTSFISFGETALVNFIGYPAASIPVGSTNAGLPIGMQIIGNQYQDEKVIQLSSEIEYAHPWGYTTAWNRKLSNM